MTTITPWIGLIAGTLTSFSFLPQILKLWHTKSAKDISVGMYCLFFSGIVLWIVYGVLIHSIPVIGTNIVTCLFILVVFYFKWRFKG